MIASATPELNRPIACIFVAEKTLPHPAGYDIDHIRRLLQAQANGFKEIEIIPSPGLSKPALLIKALELLRKCLHIELSHALRVAREKPSLVISASEISGIPVALTKLLLHHKLGHTKHVVIAHKVDAGMKAYAHRLLHWFSGVDVVICSNSLQLQYLKDHHLLPATCAGSVVFVGIDTDRFCPPSQEAAAPQNPYLVCVGKEERDYRLLLEAMRIIENSGDHPDIHVQLYPGSKWAGDYTHAGLPKPSNVTINGFVSDADIVQAYQHARGVVLPLRPNLMHAAGVNGLLEACATGKPVLMSESPGLQEYVNIAQAPTSTNNPTRNPQPITQFDSDITPQELAGKICQFWQTAYSVPLESLREVRQVVINQFSLATYSDQIVRQVLSNYT